MRKRRRKKEKKKTRKEKKDTKMHINPFSVNSRNAAECFSMYVTGTFLIEIFIFLFSYSQYKNNNQEQWKKSG